MINRYVTPAMRDLWADQHKLKTWLSVELAAVRAMEERGTIPSGFYLKLQKQSEQLNWNQFTERMQEIEKVTRHDVIAFLQVLEEELGCDAKYIHLGLTSSDIVDSSFALQLKEAGKILWQSLQELSETILKKAQQYKHTICLGRTHGQAAEPTTFGLKLLSFYAEMKRHEQRLDAAIKEISHGKLSGAVGTYSCIDPKVECSTLEYLGLTIEPVSSQIIPRDRHALFFNTLALIGGGLERMAVEIRHLSRAEVAEAFEPFYEGQKGSSAMPHKKNPILCENITGLARLLRGYAQAACENQALWHERDISHSSVERVIAPDATSVLDFALQRMTQVMKDLRVDAGRMLNNLNKAGASVYSSKVLTKLIAEGMNRVEAYAVVQRAALSGDNFLEALSSEIFVDGLVGHGELMQNVDVIFERVAS